MVQLKNIDKSFGRTVACQGVNLCVAKGEIHALVGENGAGKSTLMRILYGLIQPDGGEIQLNGQPVGMKNSQTAICLGLGMVHQHLKLIPRLSVLENIILGRESSRWGRLKLQEAATQIADLLAQLDFHLDLQKQVEALSLGEQQQLEIVKALYRQAKILILDEPTAVLSPPEIEELFQLLRKLRQQGHTIIFISHKLKEVLALADTISVMRRGRHIQTLPARETDARQLARLMLGQEITLPLNKHQTSKGKPVLEVKNLSSQPQHGHQAVRQLSFSIRAGEILGLAGVAGNGQSELVELLTGLRPIADGQIILQEKEVTHFSPRQLRQAGVAHIPEDRLQRGIIASFSLQENLLLGQQRQRRRQGWGCWWAKNMQTEEKELVQRFNIQPPDLDAPLQTFSGGNQQKAVFAREISHPYSLLIACQPTRGLDLAASAYVYQQLLAEAARGKAVLLISTELEEIMALSDRIGVIFRGQIVGIFEAGAIELERLGHLIGGHVEN